MVVYLIAKELGFFVLNLYSQTVDIAVGRKCFGPATDSPLNHQQHRVEPKNLLVYFETLWGRRGQVGTTTRLTSRLHEMLGPDHSLRRKGNCFRILAMLSG
jgi:hypothetical protein